MPVVSTYPAPSVPTSEYDHLRQGTRRQYQSGWVLVQASAVATFPHGLGEIPWLVDVLESTDAVGTPTLDPSGNQTNPVPSAVTVTKDQTNVYVTAGGTALYFQVRAL